MIWHLYIDGMDIFWAHGWPWARPMKALLLWLYPPWLPVAVWTRVSLPSNVEARTVSLHFGRDSDLEVFIHNPPDGSLAPLAYQPST